MAFKCFDLSLLGFLDELAQNNERDWFAQNKDRYEQLVREPALAFIAAMGPHLDRFAPQFDAIATPAMVEQLKAARATAVDRIRQSILT